MRRRSILTIVIHAACWLLFLSLPLVFIGGTDNTRIVDLISSFEYWFFCCTYILVFYLVANVLIPYVLLRKQYLLFSALILVLFSAVIALSPFDKLMDANRSWNGRYGQREDDRPPPPPNRQAGDDRMPDRRFGDHGMRNRRPPGDRHVDIVSIFMFLVVVALGMTIRISRQWRLSEQRAIKAEAGKAQAELSFLKAQINPHFLFNTLNNLYVLALTGSNNTAESIMRLSNIMRYVTDEAGREWVSALEEVNCIKDYLELQRLRVNKQTEINFGVEEGAEEGRIAPLILMTFVENAFKYGISAHYPSSISITLTKKDGQIEFGCSNTIFPTSEPEERSGVGIANARQRLDYLYRDKYQLQIDNNGTMFNVKLVIPFLQKV